MTPPSIADVKAARERIGDAVHASELQHNERLSSHLGRDVYLKREDTQPVRSYKLRGALNHILCAAERGGAIETVVTASAGNHAQGVAWCCARLGLRGVIVLPVRTPRQKRERIQAIGGDAVRIVDHGTVFDEAGAYAHRLALDIGALFVPAFDALEVVAGQGTVGLEIAEQLGVPAEVVAPVGGGGLLAGLTLALGEGPHRLVGVEPAGAASLQAALDAGVPVSLGSVDTFVDGAAVGRVGEVPFSVLARRRPERVLTVSEGAVAAAMIDLYQSDGIIAEPAGALSVAALEELGDGEAPVVCVLSGGNNDVSRYAEVLERSLVHRGLRHYFLVEFNQAPGALRRFLHDVLGPDDDIVLFEYTKKSNRETGPALVGIELARAGDLSGLLSRLEDSPLRVEVVGPGSPLQRFLV